MLKNEENSATLDGWTKVGDKYIVRGKYTLYKHGGTLGSSPWIMKDFPADQGQEAVEAYDEIAETIKKGGFWLVDPDGIVTKQIFKVVNKF